MTRLAFGNGNPGVGTLDEPHQAVGLQSAGSEHAKVVARASSALHLGCEPVVTEPGGEPVAGSARLGDLEHGRAN